MRAQLLIRVLMTTYSGSCLRECYGLKIANEFGKRKSTAHETHSQYIYGLKGAVTGGLQLEPIDIKTAHSF